MWVKSKFPKLRRSSISNPHCLPSNRLGRLQTQTVSSQSKNRVLLRKSSSPLLLQLETLIGSCKDMQAELKSEKTRFNRSISATTCEMEKFFRRIDRKGNQNRRMKNLMSDNANSSTVIFSFPNLPKKTDIVKHSEKEPRKFRFK